MLELLKQSQKELTEMETETNTEELQKHQLIIGYARLILKLEGGSKNKYMTCNPESIVKFANTIDGSVFDRGVTIADIYNNYVSFCKECEYVVLSKTMLSRYLKDFFNVETITKKINKGTHRTLIKKGANNDTYKP